MTTIRLINRSAHDTGLPTGSVHCIVTSPPYWGLRAYAGEQHIDWPMLDYAPMPGLSSLSIPAITCGLGEESTPEAYIGHLILIMRELWRVLRNDGTCWVNLGDSYANDDKWGGSTGGKHANGLHGKTGPGRSKKASSLKPKDLCLIPARFALAAQADGWYLRSDIIWAKPNPMPESVTDRPTKAHEYIFLLAKNQRYFYDEEAVKEEGKFSSGGFQSRAKKGLTAHYNQGYGGNGETGQAPGRGSLVAFTGTRNRRTVWNIATSPYAGAHFATWPPKLVEPMILAATSARGVCPVCGSPWGRVVESAKVDKPRKSGSIKPYADELGLSRTSGIRTNLMTIDTTTGWRPTCTCPPADPIPATVLDPFNGSGTTGTVALHLGRAYIGIDISTEYVTELAEDRIGGTQMGLAF